MTDFWTLEDQWAILRCAGLQARVHAAAPDHGIEPIVGGEGAAASCRLLALLTATEAGEPRPQLVESFIRGRDLIATYAAVPPQTVQPQIYWRALLEPSLQSVGVELIVSMQTSLLDSDPASIVLSEIPAGEVWRLVDPESSDFSYVALDAAAPLVEDSTAASLLVVRPTDEFLSYVEMIHPSDFVGLSLQLDHAPAPRVCIRSRLFPERLEKGVIRRGRARGWFVPRHSDLQTAAELFRRFIAEPPPLTT